MQEQAMRSYGTAIDWWSLGALLYEMLTGLPPWYNRDRKKMFVGIRGGDLRFPDHVPIDAPSPPTPPGHHAIALKHGLHTSGRSESFDIFLFFGHYHYRYHHHQY